MAHSLGRSLFCQLVVLGSSPSWLNVLNFDLVVHLCGAIVSNLLNLKGSLDHTSKFWTPRTTFQAKFTQWHSQNLLLTLFIRSVSMVYPWTQVAWKLDFMLHFLDSFGCHQLGKVDGYLPVSWLLDYTQLASCTHCKSFICLLIETRWTNIHVIILDKTSHLVVSVFAKPSESCLLYSLSGSKIVKVGWTIALFVIVVIDLKWGEFIV